VAPQPVPRDERQDVTLESGRYQYHAGHGASICYEVATQRE
jgi:hypothetical protein